MNYSPQSPTQRDLSAIAEWVERELRAVSDAFALRELSNLLFLPQPVAQAKPREGLIAYADGTNWDPGAGAGLYEYTGGAWRRLFVDTSALAADISGLLTREGLYQGSGCRLEVASTTSIALKPFTTPYVPVYDGTKWTFATIPQAGISISNSGLSASTTYNIYLYLNSGTPTLELSTTNPALDGTRGLYIKTGDATRFYLGALRTNGSTQFTDSETNRALYNHYNRLPKSLYKVNDGGVINLTTTALTDTGIFVTALSPPVVQAYVDLFGTVAGYNAGSGTTISCDIYSSVAANYIGNRSLNTADAGNSWAQAYTHFRGLIAPGSTNLSLYASGWVTTTILGHGYVSIRGTYYG